MTRVRLQAIGLPLLLAALIGLSGCSAGGFGSKEPTAPDTAITSYVALGDGFAAAPYTGRTKGACLRSSDNYAAKVAQALAIPTFTDVSCVGATLKSITDPSKKPAAPAQIDAVGPDTGLITLSVGIENNDLLAKMFRICVALPCGTQALPKPLLDRQAVFEQDLTATVRALQAKAPNAYVVLVGYPQISPADVTCGALPDMSADQLAAAQIVLNALNAHIQTSARQTGSAYTDVQSLSADHTACSADPWVSGKTSEPGKSVAFHPLAAEQDAVAKVVAQQVRGR
ncbi:MAG: lipolytic enzyme family [Marmoricola sp.]|nr:lipolytic enzyme family [Marmoricola sp.]